MTLHSDIWRLPGPGGFAREVAHLAGGGQHVLAVIPRYIADNPSYSDTLAVAVQNELDDPRRLYPASSQGSLAGSLGFNMTDDFDGAPVTVSDLLTHGDVAGRIFVCNATDLDSAHMSELPTFLRRLDDESRSVPSSVRATMIFILNHGLLPQDPASVATARVWYWDRVARWDVAALLAGHSVADDLAGVLGEVRLETIIEAARWDFELAIKIAQDWSGENQEIAAILNRNGRPSPTGKAVRQVAQKRPPEAQIAAWDSGGLESWHGVCSIRPEFFIERHDGAVGIFWSAQSRVLLPWLEIQRVHVEAIIREKLGSDKMNAAVELYSTRYPDIEYDATLVEFSTLARIVNARFGRSEQRLQDTTGLLRSARNRLAHLDPLSRDELHQLVQTCAWLG